MQPLALLLTVSVALAQSYEGRAGYLAHALTALPDDARLSSVQIWPNTFTLKVVGLDDDRSQATAESLLQSGWDAVASDDGGLYLLGALQAKEYVVTTRPGSAASGVQPHVVEALESLRNRHLFLDYTLDGAEVMIEGVATERKAFEDLVALLRGSACFTDVSIREPRFDVIPPLQAVFLRLDATPLHLLDLSSCIVDVALPTSEDLAAAIRDLPSMGLETDMGTTSGNGGSQRSKLVVRGPPDPLLAWLQAFDVPDEETLLIWDRADEQARVDLDLLIRRLGTAEEVRNLVDVRKRHREAAQMLPVSELGATYTQQLDQLHEVVLREQYETLRASFALLAEYRRVDVVPPLEAVPLLHLQARVEYERSRLATTLEALGIAGPTTGVDMQLRVLSFFAESAGGVVLPDQEIDDRTEGHLRRFTIRFQVDGDLEAMNTLAETILDSAEHQARNRHFGLACSVTATDAGGRLTVTTEMWGHDPIEPAPPPTPQSPPRSRADVLSSMEPLSWPQRAFFDDPPSFAAARQAAAQAPICERYPVGSYDFIALEGTVAALRAGDSGEICHREVGQLLGAPSSELDAVFYITAIDPGAVNLSLRGLDGGSASIRVNTSRPLVP